MEDVNTISLEIYQTLVDMLKDHQDKAEDIIDTVNKLIEENGLKPANDSHEVACAPIKKPKKVKMVEVCPHCGSAHIVSNGSSRGQKRYVCRSCGKSFSVNTGKISTHKDAEDKFDKFLRGMINGDTLKRLSEDCGIALPTAYNWRHKVLDIIKDSESTKVLSGVIQEDEIYLIPSFKGNKTAYLNKIDENSPNYEEFQEKAALEVPDYEKYGYREHAHKRGRHGQKGKKRGLSSDKICCATAIDEGRNVIGKPIGRGNVSSEGLDYAFSEKIEPTAIFVTDKSSGGSAFAQDKEFAHVALKSDTEARTGKYNLQLINSFHSNVRQIVTTSKAFATKYSEEYISWYGWLALNRDKTTDEKVEMIRGLRYRTADDAKTYSDLRSRELPKILINSESLNLNK